ncbi:hypothetical protein BLNAU_4755 [Blattamonas nauphoetae]|uniref:Uncharacterized protein n=1 Tax=Blattamonas nauphoetae TaxID=2049346 RepID=A0ABQ9Y8Z4_9EUKA|nr:hypothetical protein BLNAU_4755 [Blattamonas nauphoetae]
MHSGNGGSIAFFGHTFGLFNSTFKSSKSQDKCGSVFSKAQKCTISQCNFHESTSQGDSGSIYASGDNLEIINCRFVDSVSHSKGGCVIANSAKSCILFSLFVNCSSNKGGCSVHISSGTFATLTHSTLTSTSPEVSLLYVEPFTRTNFEYCAFHVKIPDHHGSDLTFEAFPSNLNGDTHLSLTTFTPQTSFRSIFSLLVPSFLFDEWLSDGQSVLNVVQTGADEDCDETRLISEIPADVHIFPTSPTLLHLDAIKFWALLSLTLHRSVSTPLVVVDKGSLSLIRCILSDALQLRTTIPFVRVLESDFFSLYTNDMASSLILQSATASFDHISSLSVTGTAKNVLRVSECPLIEAKTVDSFRMSGVILTDSKFVSTLFTFSFVRTIKLQSVTFTNTVFNSPFITITWMGEFNLDISLVNLTLLSSCVDSAAPLFRINSAETSETSLDAHLLNSSLVAPKSSVPILFSISNLVDFNGEASNTKISVAGPLIWCDDTDDVLYIGDYQNTTLFCSPLGQDTLTCGSPESPCRSIQWSVSLAFSQQQTNLTIQSSIQEGGVLIFARVMHVKGGVDDVVISPPPTNHSLSILILRYSNVELHRMIVHLTYQTTNEVQFAQVVDTSVLTLTTISLFVFSHASIFHPPISIHKSSFEAYELSTTLNHVSQHIFASSLITSLSIDDFILSSCLFDRLSFSEPIVVLTPSDDETNFALLSCSFHVVTSQSECLFRIQSSRPAIISIDLCSFDLCSCLSPRPAFIYATIPPNSKVNFEQVSTNDDTTAILLLETDDISKLIQAHFFLDYFHLLPTHFQFLQNATTLSFASCLVQPSSTISVDDSATDNLACVQSDVQMCRSVQHVLQCLENEANSEEIQISLLPQTNTLSTPISVTSNVTLISEQSVKLLSLAPKCVDKPLITLSGSLQICQMTMTVFSSNDRTSPILFSAPQSVLTLDLIAFDWNGESVNCPFIHAESAVVTIQHTTIQFSCPLLVPLVHFISTQVRLEHIDFFSEDVDNEGRLILSEGNMPFRSHSIFLSHSLSVVDTLFELHSINTTFSLTTWRFTNTQFDKDHSSIIQLTALNSEIRLIDINFVSVTGFAMRSSQLRIVLHNSSIEYFSDIYQCDLEEVTSSAVVILKDQPSKLSGYLVLVSNMNPQIHSSVLRLVCQDLSPFIHDLSDHVLNRNFLPTAVEWMQSEEDEPRYLFLDGIVPKDQFFVHSEGTDQLNCGEAAQPCRTFDYASLLPHNSSHLSFTLEGFTYFSSRLDFESGSIQIVSNTSGTTFMTANPEVNLFSSIVADSVELSGLHLLLVGDDVLDVSSFVSVTGGTLRVNQCDLNVSGSDWDSPIFALFAAVGIISDVQVFSLENAVPTIIETLASVLTFQQLRISARSIETNLILYEDGEAINLNMENCLINRQRTKWECGLIGVVGHFSESNLTFHHVDFIQQLISGGVSLVDVTCLDSTVLFENCSFVSIVPDQLYDLSLDSDSSSVLDLSLMKSTLIIKSCLFSTCFSISAIRLTLISIHTQSSSLRIVENTFTDNSASSLVIFHPISNSLFHRSSFTNNTFRNTPMPILSWEDVEKPLFLAIRHYIEMLVALSTLSGSVVLLIVVLLLSFPVFCITRRCSSHPPSFQFWWRDGGRGTKDDTTNTFVFRPVQKRTHRVEYRDEDSENGQLNIEWERRRKSRSESSQTSSDSEDVLDSVLDDSFPDEDRDFT